MERVRIVMRRFPLLLTAAFLTALVSAQGGAMGSGQGDQGGPFGGNRARRLEDLDPGLWNSRTAIVTPGEKVEYTFDLKKGETVIAVAQSDAFDPALLSVDAKDRELAKNDDRAEGDQSPLVIFRAPEAGTYRLRVLGFRGAAGGRFTLKSRTFLALDVPRGLATVPNAGGAKGSRAVFRLAAKKGEILDLRVASEARGGLGFLRVVGPSGVATADAEPILTPDGSTLFRALADGDYYVEAYADSDTKAFRTDLRAVETVAAKGTGDAAFDLVPGEIKLVEFPVVKDGVVRTTVPKGEFAYRIDGPGGAAEPETSEDDPAYGVNGAWAWFRLDRDSPDDVLRVFRAEGTVRMAFRSLSGNAQRVVLRNSESVPEWIPDVALTGDLPIGAVRIFRLTTKPTDLMRIAAKGERFQVRVEFYEPDGSRERTLMDRQRHVAEGDLYTPKGRTFLVRLFCDGYGGAGTYTLRRDVAVPTGLKVGAVTNFDFATRGFGLFTVDLEAGKRYELATDRDASATLIDGEGNELSGQSLLFGGTRYRYFTPEKSGPYRLWFPNGQGALRFVFRPYAPQGIGGL